MFPRIGFSIQKSIYDYDLYYFNDKGSIKLTSESEAVGRPFLSRVIG